MTEEQVPQGGEWQSGRMGDEGEDEQVFLESPTGVRYVWPNFLEYNTPEMMRQLRDEINADLKRAQEWKEAVTDAAVVNWTLSEENADNPRKAIADLLVWVNTITEDPAVSEFAAAKVQAEADLKRVEGELREAVRQKEGLETALLRIVQTDEGKGRERLRDIASHALTDFAALYHHGGAG